MPKPSTLPKRLQLIASGGVSRIIVALNSVITSFVIIRWQSTDLWGEAVTYLLFLDFGFSIIAWGATPFLIREFSFKPMSIKPNWNGSFWSRSPLALLFIIVILASSLPSEVKPIIIIWTIARYVYHSFESLIQFERKFMLSVIAELLGLAVVLIPVFSASKNLDINTLLLLLTLSMILKALVCSLHFRSFLKFKRPDKKYFIVAFPFLLLTFSAMLQQRADLFCVAYFLPKPEVAKYQIFINFLLFAQFLASLLLSPFAKNIFRLPKKSFATLEKRFMLIGIPLSALCTLGIASILYFLYHLEMSMALYGLGFLYILAFYFYLLKNYELGKSLQQIKVSIFSFVASVISLLLGILLVPLFKLEGALLAGLIGQLTLVLLYHFKSLSSYATR